MLELNPVQSEETDLDVNDKGLFAEQLRDGLNVFINKPSSPTMESDSDGGEVSMADNSFSAPMQESENRKILTKIENALNVYISTATMSLQSVEEKILSFFNGIGRQYPTLGSIATDFTMAKKVMKLIESVELTGACSNAEKSSALPLVFSVDFHRQVTNFLKQLLTFLRKHLIHARLEPAEGAEDDVELLNALSADVQTRELLLSGYENLLDFQFPAGFDSIERPDNNLSSNRQSRNSNSSTSTTSTPKSMSGKINNDISAAIAMISRQNTLRAEALSWCVRAAKKADRLASNGAASLFVLPVGGAKAASVDISPKSSRPSGGTPLIEKESLPTRQHNKLLSPTTPTNSQSSSSKVTKDEKHSNHYVAVHSCFSFTNSVSFSLFCSLFTTSQRQNGSDAESSLLGGCIVTANFECLKLLDFIAAADTLHGIRVSDPSVQKFSIAIEGRDSVSVLPSQVCCKLYAYDLLKTIVYPLTGMGGIYAASKYISTTSRCMGLIDPGRRLRNLSPLFFSFLQHQSVSFLVNDVLTKQLTLSPFQKWMRESLLSFHDAVLSLSNHMKKKKRQTNHGKLFYMYERNRVLHTYNFDHHYFMIH